jgi:hypothetical protein
VLTGGARWRGTERTRSTEVVEYSPRWEREEEEGKDFSFTEGIVQGIRHAKLLAALVGVVGKCDGVRR